jgi:hypothetical protein
MSDRLFQILNFVGVPLGGTTALAHNLRVDGVGLLVPDIALPQFPGAFEVVTATTTTVTLRNLSSPSGDCQVLIEAWHPVQRSFAQIPDDGTFKAHLVPQPFSAGAGAGGGAGAVPVVVLRPGGVAEENVVTTWANAVALLSLLQGPRILQFDDTIATPIVIPAGTYDMTSVIWAGGADVYSPVVQVSEGVVFTRLRTFDNRVQVEFTGTTPPVSDFDVSSPAPDTVVIDHGSTITTSGAGPFFQLGTAGGAGVVFELRQGGAFLTGTNEVLDLAIAAAQATIAVEGALANLDNDTVSGVALSLLTVQVAAAGVVQAAEDQTGFLGTLTPANATKLRQYPTAVLIANTVLSATSQIVRVNPTAGAFNVTLPAAVGARGESIVIKNVFPSANVVTVLPTGGDTIDGAVTYPLSGDHFFAQFASDGVSEWMVVGA